MSTSLVPRAIHRSESDLPFVSFGDGTHLQLLQVDVPHGLWIVRTRFEPGVTIAKHLHTGPVYAFTIAGRWKYEEYPEVNLPGSFLYEPAGSVHTLTVPKDVQGMTDVWFAIHGANINLDGSGNVISIYDASFIKQIYLATCEAQGFGRPNIVEGPL